MGKAIAAGFGPIGVVGVQDRIAEAFERGSGRIEHNFTFASHPIVCAAAAVAIRLTRERQIPARAARAGELLMRALEPLRRVACVGDVRGKGLMLGIEFVADQAQKRPFEPGLHFARRFAARCFELGLIVYPGSGTYDGIRGDHLLLVPPLVMSDDEAQRIAAILVSAAESMHKEE
jgi:adenosylmethionine-8-amino-7-oxononanoate aminotransferase